MILHRMAAIYVANNGVSEWYSGDGTPSGAANYQWPARMYILALYDAYLGLDESWQEAENAGKTTATVPCIGAGSAQLSLLGQALQVTVSSAAIAGSCTVTAQPTQ
jgi:hypothetical protein